MCRDLATAHDRDDYKDHFAWIDSIRPIHDPNILEMIDDHLLQRLLAGDVTDLDLALPEIIDWSRVDGFQYHFEFRQGVIRPEVRLADYLGGLAYHISDLSVVDVTYLRRRSIRALDADGHEVHKWSVWRCLTGEFEFNGSTFVIDEGQVFEVSTDFLDDINRYLSGLRDASALPWPSVTATTLEDVFNKDVSAALAPALVMDKKLVQARTQTTPIEVCDVLTANRQLIHVKRHLNSSELSHLFSQGYVSASLLQSDTIFREATHLKIKELNGDPSLYFFDVTSLQTIEYEIIFVIVADWHGRTVTEALPFFSKINLERTASELLNRGLR